MSSIIQSVIGGGATIASEPLKLYSHAGGPNPWKVAIVLNELNLPYETIVKDFSELKNSTFEDLNPNGRVPALTDPNTGLTLWESGAIIEYLIETYDSKNELRYTSGKEKWQQKCWEQFQMSGQGPYYGQRAWFVLYHSEKNLTSCLDRYGSEVHRVLGVIDSHLKKTGQQYLVGDKCTYPDLMFMPWHWLLLGAPNIMGEGFAKEWEESYPEAWKWNERVQGREAVTKAKEARAEAMKQAHH